MDQTSGCDESLALLCPTLHPPPPRLAAFLGWRPARGIRRQPHHGIEVPEIPEENGREGAGREEESVGGGAGQRGGQTQRRERTREGKDLRKGRKICDQEKWGGGGGIKEQ